MLSLFKSFCQSSKNIFPSTAFRMGLYDESELTYPEAQHQLGWSTRRKHLDFLYNLIKWKQPKVIVETGTFEGHGTFALAAAAHENNNNAKIFTFDYDGDPVQDSDGNVTDAEWLELRKIRKHNLEIIEKRFPGCLVQFTDGDTRKVLSGVISKNDKWDFWYQDSMHYAEGIRQEWDIMAPFSADGAMIIFDDISKKNNFSKWFAKDLRGEWDIDCYRDFDHRQCIAQHLIQHP
jgi:predicted O-methyltransferase YrrM